MGSPSNLHLVLLSVDVIIERIQLETEIKDLFTIYIVYNIHIMVYKCVYGLKGVKTG